MKTRQKSLHDEGRQSRAGQEIQAKKLDDVRVAEGAHQLAFLRELGRDQSRVQEDVVNLFGGADGSRHGHLLDAAVGSCADCGTSEPYVCEHERLQLRVVTKILRHCSKLRVGQHGA